MDNVIMLKSELFNFLDARPALNLRKFADDAGIPQSVVFRRKVFKRDTWVVIKKDVLELYGWGL